MLSNRKGIWPVKHTVPAVHKGVSYWILGLTMNKVAKEEL